MIKLIDFDGRAHYVSPLAIARITEAGPNWHGIACYVRTFDGKTIESRDTAADIADQINKHQALTFERIGPYCEKESGNAKD